MSKHNYTNYSKPNVQPEVKSEVEPGAVNTEVLEPINDTVPVTEENIEVIEEANVSAFPVDVEEPVLEASLDAEAEENDIDPPAEPITGVVTAAKLNVRKFPSIDGGVIVTLPKGTEVQIDPEHSTVEWYKVYTPTGTEGFCMKKFIEVK